MNWKGYASLIGFLKGGVETLVTDSEPLPVILLAAELTERMLNARPAPGYQLWHDVPDASFTYVLEAPAAAGATDTGFRGIRVTKDADGNPLGKVEVNTGGTLTFNNRTSDPGWS